MSERIIEKLYHSFNELETALSSAKSSLANRESVPDHILDRLKTYDDILARQRELAGHLVYYVQINDIDQISRHVSLINGLSQMIRDDARGVLNTLMISGEGAEGQVDEESQLESDNQEFHC